MLSVGWFSLVPSRTAPANERGGPAFSRGGTASGFAIRAVRPSAYKRLGPCVQALALSSVGAGEHPTGQSTGFCNPRLLSETVLLNGAVPGSCPGREIAVLLGATRGHSCAKATSNRKACFTRCPNASYTARVLQTGRRRGFSKDFMLDRWRVVSCSQCALTHPRKDCPQVESGVPVATKAFNPLRPTHFLSYYKIQGGPRGYCVFCVAGGAVLCPSSTFHWKQAL